MATSPLSLSPDQVFAIKRRLRQLIFPLAALLGRANRGSRRIYDMFLFNREIELLELRLSYLYPVVDVFIIGESETTFKGEKKPLFFAQNRERFAKYADKIRHVIIPAPVPGDYEPNPCHQVAKTSEFFQRRYLRQGLTDCRSCDIVMVSDADEIPRRSTLFTVAGLLQLGFPAVLFRQEWYLLYLNARVFQAQGRRPPLLSDWFGTVATTFRNFQALYEADANRLWAFRWGGANRCLIQAPRGGWHFSFMGGLDAIVKKLSDNACKQLDETDWAALQRREFLGNKFKIMDPAQSFPEELRPHLGAASVFFGSEGEFAEILAKWAARAG